MYLTYRAVSVFFASIQLLFGPFSFNCGQKRQLAENAVFYFSLQTEEIQTEGLKRDIMKVHYQFQSSCLNHPQYILCGLNYGKQSSFFLSLKKSIFLSTHKPANPEVMSMVGHDALIRVHKTASIGQGAYGLKAKEVCNLFCYLLNCNTRGRKGRRC